MAAVDGLTLKVVMLIYSTSYGLLGRFRNGSLMPSLEMLLVNRESDWWWQNNTDIDAGNNIDRVVFNYTPGYNNEPDNSN